MDYYALTKDKVYQKMCNVIEWINTTNQHFVGDFQDFVMVCAFSCLAKKPVIKGTQQPGSKNELMDELRALFPNCSFKTDERNKNFTYIITPKWKCEFIFYSERPEFTMLGTSFPFSSSPMRGVLPLKAYDNQFDLLKEWFPDNCKLEEYVNKKRKLHEIFEETIKVKVHEALEPQGIKYFLRMNCLIPDSMKDHISLNVAMNSESCLRMRLNESELDSVLSVMPKLIMEFRQLSHDDISLRIREIKNILPKQTYVDLLSYMSYYSPLHTTSFQL